MSKVAAHNGPDPNAKDTFIAEAMTEARKATIGLEPKYTPEDWAMALAHVRTMAEENPNAAMVYRFELWAQTLKQMVTLIGPAGVGKSSVLEWVVAEINRRSRSDVARGYIINATTKMPTDLSGLPVKAAEDKVRFVAIGIMREAFEAAYQGHLVYMLFDELTALSQTMLNALMSIITERQAGDLRVPPNVIFIGAANPPEMLVAAGSFSEPMVNRLAQFEIVDSPQLQASFLEWLAAQIKLVDADPLAWKYGEYAKAWINLALMYYRQNPDRILLIQDKKKRPRSGVGPEAQFCTPRGIFSGLHAVSHVPPTKASAKTPYVKGIFNATIGINASSMFCQWVAAQREYGVDQLMGHDWQKITQQADTVEVEATIADVLQHGVAVLGYDEREAFVRAVKAMTIAGLSPDQRRGCVAKAQVPSLAVIAMRKGWDVMEPKLNAAIREARGEEKTDV